jgi:hypothetical protein
MASIEGQDYTLDTIGPIGCEITDTGVNAGFILGDNEVSLIVGATADGSEWQGRIALDVQDSELITNYFVDFSEGGGEAVAVEGNSMSYSGEWWKLGREGEEESVGDGTLSLTC